MISDYNKKRVFDALAQLRMAKYAEDVGVIGKMTKNSFMQQISSSARMVNNHSQALKFTLPVKASNMLTILEQTKIA